MSFSLLFLPRVGALPIFDTLATWAKPLRAFTAVRDAEGMRLDYHNRETGVAFTLNHIRAEDDDEEDSLVLHLEYARPTFFALETMTVLADLAEHFRLDVINPHGSAEREPFSREELVQSWKEGNRAACAEIKDEGQPRLFMPEAKSLEMWRYLQLCPQIQEMEEDFTVPRPSAVRLKGEGENAVQRLATLPRPCLLVVPPADLFVLDNDRVVPAEQVLAVLGPHLSGHDVWAWLKIVDENALDQPALTSAWDDLHDNAANAASRDQFEPVEFDAFVDVDV